MHSVLWHVHATTPLSHHISLKMPCPIAIIAIQKCTARQVAYVESPYTYHMYLVIMPHPVTPAYLVILTLSSSSYLTSIQVASLFPWLHHATHPSTSHVSDNFSHNSKVRLFTEIYFKEVYYIYQSGHFSLKRFLKI